MSPGVWIVLLMWAVVLGAVLWAVAAGRQAAREVGYRSRARLVDLPARVPHRPAHAESPQPSTAAAGRSRPEAGAAQPAASAPRADSP